MGLAQTRPLAMILLAFVVPLQFVAAILAYFTRDAAAATAIGLFGMTWAAVSLATLTSPEIGATSTALGLFMMAIAVLMVLLGVSSIAGKPVFAVVLALATARFFVTGLYQWTGRHGLETASEWLGIPLCAGRCTWGWRCCSRTRSGIPSSRSGVGARPESPSRAT